LVQSTSHLSQFASLATTLDITNRAANNSTQQVLNHVSSIAPSNTGVNTSIDNQIHNTSSMAKISSVSTALPSKMTTPIPYNLSEALKMPVSKKIKNVIDELYDKEKKYVRQYIREDYVEPNSCIFELDRSHQLAQPSFTVKKHRDFSNGRGSVP
jgi:hypothetical protein